MAQICVLHLLLLLPPHQGEPLALCSSLAYRLDCCTGSLCLQFISLLSMSVESCPTKEGVQYNEYNRLGENLSLWGCMHIHSKLARHIVMYAHHWQYR